MKYLITYCLASHFPSSHFSFSNNRILKSEVFRYQKLLYSNSNNSNSYSFCSTKMVLLANQIDLAFDAEEVLVSRCSSWRFFSLVVHLSFWWYLEQLRRFQWLPMPLKRLFAFDIGKSDQRSFCSIGWLFSILFPFELFFARTGRFTDL